MILLPDFCKQSWINYSKKRYGYEFRAKLLIVYAASNSHLGTDQIVR
jgi:hypothetical protein